MITPIAISDSEQYVGLYRPSHADNLEVIMSYDIMLIDSGILSFPRKEYRPTR